MHVACEMQKRLRTLDLRLSCSHILSHTFSCSHALMLSLSVCSHAHMNTTLATLRLTPLPTSFQVKRQNVKVSKCQSVKVSKHQSIKASKSQRVKASRLTCHTRKNENRFASADSSDQITVSFRLVAVSFWGARTQAAVEDVRHHLHGVPNCFPRLPASDRAALVSNR